MKYKLPLLMFLTIMATKVFYSNPTDSHIDPPVSETTILDCTRAVSLAWDEGTDMYMEQLHACLYHDPDYLTALIQDDEYISTEEQVQ